MKQSVQTIAAIAALAVLASAAPAQAATDAFSTKVRIDTGSLAGATHDGVLSFKGIPFAAPPVGALRWRAPQPARSWKGLRSATKYGHDCAQKPFPSDAAPLGTPPAEDCLVLNVWRPAANAGDKPPGKLPVMVWIYGGGFVNGGSSPAIYDGSQFAKRGIVFVSFNYRLGRFGFFAHPALTNEHPEELHGNYGYMDQIAALKWVRRNIAQFGGDPANVTLFGESAGGVSVHVMLTSPLSQGLFSKAIVESGGGRGLIAPQRPLHGDAADGTKSAESIGVNFAKANGITGEGAAALKALRRLPATKLINGLNMASMDEAQATYPSPMTDGRLVVEVEESAYRAGHNVRVPLIIGANSEDIGLLHASSLDEVFATFGANAAKAHAVYDPDHSGDFGLLKGRVGMDKSMIEPARFTAAVFAAQGLPAYEYRFSYVASGLQPGEKAAPHASEIPFVFDTVVARYGKRATPADAAVAKAMNAYWINFAKTGNPNGAGLPEWPAYSAATDMLMNFTPNDGPRGETDAWRARLDLTEAAANTK